MDSRPRRAAPGRLPDRIYWRRRAVVLVALVLVIAVIAAIASAIRGRSTTATPATTPSVQVTEPSVTPTPTDTPSASQSPSLSASASASPTVTAAPSSTAPTECVPNLLSLAVTGPRTVAASAKADLEVTLTNTGQVACVIVFDTRFVLRVVSGTDEVWSTADCAAWRATGTQTVQPGAVVAWKTTWDRHRSQKECKVVPTALKAGTYVANAMYTGAVPAIWSMNLTA